MKALLLLLLFGISSVNAQSQIDSRKFIQVTGSAEMSIKPDEIELKVVLSEYDKDGKIVRLDDIESEFAKILKSNKINPESISYESKSSWYWWYWWSYRNNPAHFKTVTLKLNKDTNFLKLVEDLNKQWTHSIQISNTSNKEIQRLRKEVKIEAMKAAKAKATYLLESVDEEIGGLLEVEEMPEATTSYWFNPQNITSNSYVSNSSNQNNSIDNASDIKLRYEVKAKFEIK